MSLDKRPGSQKKPQRTTVVSTIGDKERWIIEAAEHGMGLSEYIRWKMNHNPGLSQESLLLTRILAQQELLNRALMTWIINQGIELEP